GSGRHAVARRRRTHERLLRHQRDVERAAVDVERTAVYGCGLRDRSVLLGLDGAQHVRRTDRRWRRPVPGVVVRTGRMGVVKQIRYDDLDALRALISDEYGPWGPEFEVTQELIDDFADLTGDHQWIHVDPERAKDGPFGAPIAHGLLTLAIG